MRLKSMNLKKQIKVWMHFIQNFGCTVGLGLANVALALALAFA